MPHKAAKLTPKQVRELEFPEPRPDGKARVRFVAVGGVPGLNLQLTSGGTRSWVLQYSIFGKVRTMGLGSYDELSLTEARTAAKDWRQIIRQGRDPLQEKEEARQAAQAAQLRRLTFAQAAQRCYDAKEAGWGGGRKKDFIRSLERHAFPHIGDLDVAEIEVSHVQAVLEPIWHTKTPIAVEIRQRLQAVLDWAEASDLRPGPNPARWQGKLKHLLPAPTKIHKPRHHRALPWQDVPAFMADLREQGGMGARALEFAVLTAARSGEVRLATWDEMDLGAKLWTIPGERTKTGKPHAVPLSGDAVKLLKALPEREDGSPYVFAAPRGGALSDMSLSAVCRRMGVDAVPHGFRSSFKDWARNRSKFPDEVSELALAHVNSDATRAAYARDELLPQRTQMMRAWAKFLREGAGEAEVTPIGVQIA